MRYALLVCGDEDVIIGHEDEAAREAAFTARLDELRASGTDPDRVAAFNRLYEDVGDRLLDGIRLRPTTASTTVRVRDGGVVIADGPFAETKEQIAGVLIVDCQDSSEAIKWAAQASSSSSLSVTRRWAPV